MKKVLAFSTLALAVSSSVQADIRINGFANLIAGKASSDDLLYGYDEDFSFSEESLFAIQLSGDVNDKMTATGQLVARGRDDYDVGFEWAYLTYNATDHLSVSAGRLRAPLFRYSASLDVGYSYHWVSAPKSVYSVPFNNIDGVRVDYSDFAGDLEYTFQFVAGRLDSHFTLQDQPGYLEGKNVASFTAEGAYGNWKLRGVAARGDFTFEIPALQPLVAQLTQINADLGDLVDARDDSGAFFGIGAEYDNFNWFVSGEVTLSTLEDSYYSDNLNYYVTAGKRIDKFTPFVTVEWSDSEGDIKFLDEIAALPVPLQGAAGAIITGSQQALFAKSQAYSVGLRYDYATNIALKADLTRFDDKREDAQDASLFRVAVNYIF